MKNIIVAFLPALTALKCKNIIVIYFLAAFSFAVGAQKRQIVIADFEKKPNIASWWVDNSNVKLNFDENKENQPIKKSKVCLHVRWDSVPANRPYAWFTDLKADTFAAPGMEEQWKLFKEQTWMSFWAKAGSGDTILLNYLILSKEHKSKWGATKMIPLLSTDWTFVKVKFADLCYDDWGVVKTKLDLKSDIVKCFEVGLRLSANSSKGFVEAWFDNIKLTNYEPFK